MRQHYTEIQERNAEILAIGPESVENFRTYWDENDLPFPGLADLGSKVARAYRQQVKVLKFGRMPLLLIIDPQGKVRYRHSGESMQDVVPVDKILQILDEINQG